MLRDRPEAGIELIDPTPQQVVYGSGTTTLETGRGRLHAIWIDGDLVRPACDSAKRRVLPTGAPWSELYPEHLERCTRCFDLYPVAP